MIIYDDVKKNIKIAIFSKQNNILDKVKKVVEKEEFKVQIYDDLDKLLVDIEKNKVKILVYLIDNINELDSIKRENIKLITYYNKDINIEALKVEIIYNIKIIEEETRIDFEKYKLEIVANLVESISHKIQANLLILGASQDVIKMINGDLNENDQKKEILDSLYDKNQSALEKSNVLLQLISNATAISYESVMTTETIIDIVKLILDEYLKENETILNIEEKIKQGSYICGPLNDVIFIICRIIKLLIDEDKNKIKLEIFEDESNWFFNIYGDDNIEDIDSIEKIKKFVKYVKNVKSKITDKQISIIIKKIR